MPEGSYSIKRRSERKALEIPVILVVGEEGDKHSGMTVDVSSGGLRLQCDATLFPGQPVRLHLAALPTSFQAARVVWVGKTESPEAGQAGFEFLTPSSGLVH